MEISLNTAYICTIGSMEKTLEAFKKVGFETFDYSLSFLIEQCDTYIDKENYLEKTRNLRKFADKLGLKCNQSHSFMKYVNKNNTKEENDYLWTMCTRSIEMASIMGAKYIVIHPFSSYTEDENVEMFRNLSTIARKNNISIAIENMCSGLFSNETNINSLLEKINRDNVVFCLDIGHAELPKEVETSAVTIIKNCSKYLRCLHVHDNDKYHDSHELPGNCLLNFDEIFKALKEVGYDGDLTFEVDGYLYNNYPVEQRDKGLAPILECGKKLVKMYEKL